MKKPTLVILSAALLLLAVFTGCRSDPAPAFLWAVTGTVWNITEIEDQVVGAEKLPTLQLEAGGDRVIGFGGVNRLSGTYQLKGDALSFGPLAVTRMAGKPQLMEIEDRFLRVLPTVTSCRVDGNRLELSAGEKVIVRAQAMPATPFPPR